MILRDNTYWLLSIKNLNKSHRLKLDTLAKQHPDNVAVIKEFHALQPNISGLAFYSLTGKYRDIVAVLDEKTAEVIDYINLNPWRKINTPKSNLMKKKQLLHQIDKGAGKIKPR